MARKAKKPFVPPTLEEVQEYVHDNHYDVDAQEFLWHYAKLGWKNVNGKPVKNWKQTLIQVWVKLGKGKVVEKPTRTKLFPISGKTCGRRNCRMPAVYKDASGAYDTYCCTKHLPDEVKELYE